MNSKASRNELQWPPLLNMSDNRPAIHNNFQSAERNNAPFVNEMLTPHYKKEVKTEYKTTFDKYDNKYDIHDGALYKNDEKLFDVDNRKFVQEDVTDQYNKYLSFDYDEDGNLATLVQNPDNSFTIDYKGQKTNLPILFASGIVTKTRLRCMKGRPFVVILYAVSGNNSLRIHIWDGTRSYDRGITWITQFNKHNYTDGNNLHPVSDLNKPDYGNINIDLNATTVNPLIQMSTPNKNYFAVSILSNYSEQIYTLGNGYYTFLCDFETGEFLDGTNCKPRNKTERATVTTDTADEFVFSSSSSISRTSYEMYKNDEDVWIDVNTRQPIDSIISIEGMEPEYSGQTIPIDGVNQPIYTASYNKVTYTFTCKMANTSGHTYKYKFKVEYGEDQEKEEILAFSDSLTATTTFSIDGWGIGAENVTITNTIIDTSDSNKEYPATDSSLSITQTVVRENTTIGWAIAPNFFLDDGTIHAYYVFRPWANIPYNISGSYYWGQDNRAILALDNTFNAIIESATLGDVTFSSTNGYYDFTSKEYHTVTYSSMIPRSNCVSAGQNFWSNTAMLCSSTMYTPYQIYQSKLTGDGKNFLGVTIWQNLADKYVMYSNSNSRDLRYWTGCFPNSDYKFYSMATAASVDVAWYQVGGFRSRATRGGWNILYYSSDDGVSDIQGLSWSKNKDDMGTLISPWNKVDSTFYIVFTEDFMIYKNTDGRIIKVSIEEGNELRSEFNNSFIIVNTTSFWNCYDVEQQRKYHYATDYNNRMSYGIPRSEWAKTANQYYTVAYKDSRKGITSINAAFNNSKDSVVSLQVPQPSLSWWIRNKVYNQAYQSTCPTDPDVQPIEIYYQGSANDNATINGTQTPNTLYRFSIIPYAIPTSRKDNALVGVIYTGTSTNYSPDIFANYINGAGNNDFIKEGKSAYPIAFNNFGRPIFVFTVTGEALDVEAFFVIQGQYYAVMNEKIYALSYMNGYIQNQDAVIDVRGMKFVGNTPEIAFFWSEKKKAFYSYTGDGILQQIFDATKYSLEKFTFKYYYDETVQSIWIPTTTGLLCFGAKNTYLMEDIVDVENVIFTENYTYIIHKNGYTILTYFYENDFEPIPIELETSFYGVGNNEVSTIDRWQITLYDERHPKVDVKLSVRSITDVTVKAEEKVFHIGESDWDKWSHSILLSYSPKLIKGQGIRLYIETPVAIQKIVPHVADQGHVSTTKFQM